MTEVSQEPAPEQVRLHKAAAAYVAKHPSIEKMLAIADECCTSLPTFKRWAQGRNLAHPYVAVIVADVIERRLAAEEAKPIEI